MLLWFFIFVFSPLVLLFSIFVPILRPVGIFVFSLWMVTLLFGASLAAVPEFTIGLISNIFLSLIFMGATFVYCFINVLLFCAGAELIPFRELTDLFTFVPMF
jgi:hypothetical protein